MISISISKEGNMGARVIDQATMERFFYRVESQKYSYVLAPNLQKIDKTIVNWYIYDPCGIEIVRCGSDSRYLLTC